MLKKENTVLHIIDIQERIFNVMHNPDFIRENMVRMTKAAHIFNIPIIWMEQYPKGLGSTIPELNEILSPQKPMEKMCFSSCGQSDFNTRLKQEGRNQILIMGIEAHVCVYQTVSGLLEQGYHVEVIADAVSSRTEKNYEMGLRVMESLGAKLTTVEMTLLELLEEAGTDEFKQISKLVK